MSDNPDYYAPPSPTEGGRTPRGPGWVRWLLALICWFYGTFSLLLAASCFFLTAVVAIQGSDKLHHSRGRELLLYEPSTLAIIHHLARTVAGITGILAGFQFRKGAWGLAIFFAVFLLAFSMLAYKAMLVTMGY